MTSAEGDRARRALRTRLEIESLFGLEELPVAHDSRRLETPDEPEETPPAAQPGPEEWLEALREEVAACRKCEIAATRNRSVFGEGDPRARLLFVGEAPGADEDRTGRPFVGRAGQLLTKIIQSIGLERSEVYIANVLKCRPPGNRTPRPDEVENCFPYLHLQIAGIRPQVICTLGAPAARALLGLKGGISAHRGRVFRYEGIVVVPTFHPAYLLRNPAEKIKVWRDIQLVAKLLQKQPA
jgi:DNA polymerase